MLKTMIRNFVIFTMAIGLSVTTFACAGEPSNYASNQTPVTQQSASPVSTTISDGSYPVQQATYDDGTGEYTLMLLNAAPGQSPYRVANLQMARLSDAEISNGQKTYLKVENGQPIMYLTEDFRIEYVHNVTENQTNPQTGQQETVVVRRESNFWTPFAGALAGQALGSLLFTPHYYIPPVYQPGVALTGYGGYGRSYNDAVSSYRTKYNAAPAEVKNRQTFRTTGQLRRSPSVTSSPSQSPRVNSGNRSTGSGYGSTDLNRSNTSKPSKVRTPSFGSGGARRRVGGRRR